MIRNRNILTTFSFAAMFFPGVGSAIIGAASRNIGLSPDQIGLLLIVGWAVPTKSRWVSSAMR